MKLCAHCGQPLQRFHEIAEFADLAPSLRLPRRERQVVGALIDRYPRFMRSDEFVGVMWDDEADAMPAPEKVVYSHISKLRRKLWPHGWTVDSMRHTGYRLARYLKEAA